MRSETYSEHQTGTQRQGPRLMFWRGIQSTVASLLRAGTVYQLIGHRTPPPPRLSLSLSGSSGHEPDGNTNEWKIPQMPGPYCGNRRDSLAHACRVAYTPPDLLPSRPAPGTCHALHGQTAQTLHARAASLSLEWRGGHF